jgi:hypothetical protein
MSARPALFISSMIEGWDLAKPMPAKPKTTGSWVGDVTGASASPLFSVNYVRSQYLAGNQKRHNPTQNDLFSSPLLTQLLAQRRNPIENVRTRVSGVILRVFHSIESQTTGRKTPSQLERGLG